MHHINLEQWTCHAMQCITSIWNSGHAMSCHASHQSGTVDMPCHAMQCITSICNSGHAMSCHASHQSGTVDMPCHAMHHINLQQFHHQGSSMLNQIIMVGEKWEKADKSECSLQTSEWNSPHWPQKHSDIQNLSPVELFIMQYVGCSCMSPCCAGSNCLCTVLQVISTVPPMSCS